MTREEAIAILQTMEYELSNQVGSTYCRKKYDAVRIAIKALEQESAIKALGEELRKARKGIADEKVLIGFNMAIAICNKYLGESEVQE